MAPNAVRVVVLARGADDPALVERAYREVLAPSFTPDEIPSLAGFSAEAAEQTIVVAFDADDELLAASVSDEMVSAPVALLSYLAVRPGLRSTGVGSAMMGQLRERWSQGEAEVVLGEVHDPRCWPDGDDERPSARLRFYERHGARVLTVPWVQPRLREDGERVGGMVLLVWGRHGPPASVPAAWLRAWIADYYLEAEGLELPTDDPMIAALLDRVDARDPVEAKPISDLPDVALLDDSAGG